jgi:Diguanylate cyclase, GGDEF domain
VLQQVARVLGECVRDGDVVARLGGDEFGVLLSGARAETAARVAQRMVETVDADGDGVVTLSIGVASGPTSQILELLSRADEAMYVAKRAGGNRADAGQSSGGDHTSPRSMPAARPFPDTTSAILREASSIISSPSMTAPVAPPFSDV